MRADSAASSGAEQILRYCLGLTAGQEVLVFVDETTVEVGVVIAEAAYRLGVSQTTVLVPLALQRRIPTEIDLSLPIQGAAREARAILTCVNATPECLPFRDRVLETHWGAHAGIGHMPGATLDVLRLANVDFERLISDCHHLELAMARGRVIEFVSYAPDGTSHRLAADIGGWERLPVASDGVVRDGVWGNVPSGETYIAPIEGSAEGSIVVDGSVPGLVVEPGMEIVLHFEQGRLARIDPESGPAVHHLYQTQFRPAQKRDDSNWSMLAEIGIGVNPAVDHLTGNMIFDEKAAGTAHIALGTNTYMGGNIEATIHCDMVVKGPSIAIDGRTILEHGALHFVESEWRQNYAGVPLEGSPLRTAVEVARSGIQADESTDGRLQRLLRSEPGRVSACLVGDDETARLACVLYSGIPAEGDWLPVEELATTSKLEPETVRRLLHVMWDYSLIKARPDHGELKGVICSAVDFRGWLASSHKSLPGKTDICYVGLP